MTMRSQLLRGLLGVTLLCMLFAGTAMYRILLVESSKLCDNELRTIANTVPIIGARFAAVRPGEPEEPVTIGIRDPAGRLVYASTSQSLPMARMPGHSTISYNGERWRVYLVRRDGFLIQAAQRQSARTPIAIGMALRSFTPFVLVTPVLALLMHIVIGRGLRPLERLAGMLATQRSPEILAALPGMGQPAELMSVVSALNGLLQRIEDELSSQRRFVVDAARQLRLPLAALKLQLLLAQRAETGPQRRIAFEKLHQWLERAIRLTHQLPVAARQGSLPGGTQIEKVDLLALARACVAEHSVKARARKIDLGIPACAVAVAIDGHADDLRVLLNHLIDNAIRYTQPGGWVDVVVEQNTEGICLRVTDNGPGIGTHERDRVFNRFEGNGLSIVAGVAAAHGADVTLGDNLSGFGLCMTVRFDAGSAVCGSASDMNKS